MEEIMLSLDRYIHTLIFICSISLCHCSLKYHQKTLLQHFVHRLSILGPRVRKMVSMWPTQNYYPRHKGGKRRAGTVLTRPMWKSIMRSPPLLISIPMTFLDTQRAAGCCY